MNENKLELLEQLMDEITDIQDAIFRDLQADYESKSETYKTLEIAYQHLNKAYDALEEVKEA